MLLEAPVIPRPGPVYLIDKVPIWSAFDLALIELEVAVEFHVVQWFSRVPVPQPPDRPIFMCILLHQAIGSCIGLQF